MSVQHPGGKVFSPSFMAMAMCLATSQATFAADTEKPAPLELGATEISGQQLGDTTEGTQSYTTGEMATATKLPLSMRETPQAVTVITRQRMDDQAMTSVNDVVKNTPGLFLSQASGPGRQTYKSRGFDIDNMMFDGLPSAYSGYANSVQPNLAMFDRVEVIRGATGLVTGAGNPSAAINFVRKRPTLTPQVSITGAAGSWDDYRGELDASSALNDSGTLRGRVVGSYRDANSFRDKETSDHGLFYAIGEADLSENTTATLGFSQQEDQTNYFWGGLPLGADGHHLNLPRSTNPGSDWENKKLTINTVFGDVQHRFDNGWKLNLAGSASQLDGVFTGTYQSRYRTTLARTAYQSHQDDKQYAFDTFASGPVEAFGRTHEVVVGTSKRILDATSKEYSPYDTNYPLNGAKPDFVRNGKGHAITSQDGVYLTTRLNLADPLKVILGGRLDWYDYDDRQGNGDYKVTRNLTRYAGVIYDLDEHHSVYASYTDIFTPQSSKDLSGKVLEPIVGENYEVGLKGEYFNGALNASVAVFQIDQKNRATQAATQLGCPQLTCYDASGLVRSQGIDLELQGALTENWQVGGGFTYTRVHYIKDTNAANKNQRFDTDTPERMFKLTTSYRFQGPLEKLRIGGNVYWQSRMYNDVVLADSSRYRLEQGSYAVADVMAGYQVTRHLDLQVNVNNLFDRTYYSAIGTSPIWGSTDTYGNPRSFGLTAKYTF
ncbi:TonB-dependent receptor [Pseudomonas fluorescens]|uniref:TonB-dependent siderophore receptor n=1 Tax=Pseudomonas fluorescens TaxID=294 RepID=A0A1B3CTK9_PSEFL|nr:MULTISPECIES: TonB-dependent siderophore receptor [Pseudomonas]AOE68400.1 TonB-dependent receptor [Pseudomonas fluorescens]AOE74207.1 TonB-dependent receptor [Pseudomonas fluorescens]QOU02599.1 TonB-dependent siderophore receptor [Pseudomonas fluorescens]WLD64760.1 TonB-dependent siderophore receptor [Pseudomonas sp. OVF7]